MASGEPYAWYKVYDKTWTNVLISGDESEGASTVSELLQSQDAISLWITAVSWTIWWEALSGSIVLENYYDSAPNRELWNLFLYDVTPESQAEIVTGFYLDWTEYKFDWGWGWDMSYSDFWWQTKTWATITLDLASTYEPSADFTVNAPATIKDWQTYILRVNNGATAYTMTLGTNVTNPYGTSIELTANWIDQFVFLAIDWELELQPEWGGWGWGIDFAPNSPLKPKYRWYWTQEQYEALSQYYTDEENDTVYYTI